MIACACVAAAVLSTAACSPRRIPPMTVSDLMEDRVALDGVLMKCNSAPQRASNNTDCLNARIAIERLAAKVEPAAQAKHAEDFERSREELRAAEDKKRQQELDAKPKLDAYHLPVVPVDPVPATPNQTTP
jgi:hypothetical protein